jgi:hypothetical protein
MFAVPRPIFLAMIEPLAYQFGKIVHRAHIDHADLCPGQTGQGIDAGTAADEIMNHLGGHLGGIFRDALGCDPMIADHDHHFFSLHRRMHGTGHARQINGQIHQIAQGPMRHGQLIEAVLSLEAELEILGIYSAEGRIEKTQGVFGVHSLVLLGMNRLLQRAR